MPKKIYVADDSVVTRMFISSIINEIPNVEIEEFANGEEVLNKIKKALPDLLILDSVMPKMDGLSVLSKLKENNIKIPIIFFTADIQATTREKAISLGIAEFVNKPLQKEVILEKIKNILFNK
ncbi:MAG: response regulator [Bacteroidales bacterium]|nr:response regulator [Bacteroidales bacterium]